MAGLFSRFSKRERASRANESGLQLRRNQQLAAAMVESWHRREVRGLPDQWHLESAGARIASIELAFSRDD